MIERIRKYPFETAAIFITAANILLVWSFRFLPLYDYPIWLYEVKIMRSLSDPPFSSLYEIAAAPIPNMGFVVPVWLMSFLVPIETAGKIFLSVCVAALPWSFWFCARRISGSMSTPLAYAGFPFAFNLYFFSGNAFLLGLIVVLMMIGIFFPRIHTFTLWDWFTLSFAFLISCFVHAAAFIIAVIAFAGLVCSPARQKVWQLAASLLPSVFCFALFMIFADAGATTSLQWSVWVLAQNVFKPIFLFVKSYSIPNPLPLTLLNAGWVVLSAMFLTSIVRETRRQEGIDKRFLIPAFVLLMLCVALPDTLFGVKNPGSRFGLPLLFFLILMHAHAQRVQWWKVLFLAVAACVTAYNACHFQKVNEQMQQLYVDMSTNFNLMGKSFRSFRFDYPPPRTMPDVAAASIDPLFGVASYAALDSGGATWIFGTSLLRYADGADWLNPKYVDSTADALALTLLSSSSSPNPYDLVVLVGKNRIVDERLMNHPSKKTLVSEHWAIVESVRPLTGNRK